MHAKAASILIAIGVAYVLFAGLMFLVQRSFLYFPSGGMPDPARVGAAGLIQEVQAETADGLTLTGWYRAAQPGQPTLIWFHGNARSHAERWPLVTPYVNAGFGVLLASYRGYGGNPGAPSEAGLLRDGRAWLNTLAARNVPDGDWVLYGESLGSGVAVAMAVERPDIRALVLQAPFTSVVDIAQRRFFFLPVGLLLQDRFDSRARIAGVTAPVLIMHGERDRVVPVVYGERLHAAVQGPKALQLFPQAGHNDLPIDAMAETAMQFLADLEE